MNDILLQNFEAIDKDLSHSWIELNTKVRDLVADLKLKAAGSDLANDAEHLSQQTSRLCDHVERMHADVIDLLENIETRIPLPERDARTDVLPAGEREPNEIDKQKIDIQREIHELRNDFIDVLKALFMWVDNPKKRLQDKEK